MIIMMAYINEGGEIHKLLSLTPQYFTFTDFEFGNYKCTWRKKAELNDQGRHSCGCILPGPAKHRKQLHDYNSRKRKTSNKMRWNLVVSQSRWWWQRQTSTPHRIYEHFVLVSSPRQVASSEEMWRAHNDNLSKNTDSKILTAKQGGKWIMAAFLLLRRLSLTYTTRVSMYM